MEQSVNEILFYPLHPATVIIYTRTDLLLYLVSFFEKKDGATRERSVAKENLVLQRWSNLATRETPIIQKKLFLLQKRKWNDILACKHFKGYTFEAEVSKLDMRFERRYDHDGRETDGAVHWNSTGPKLRKAFHKAGRQKFSDSRLALVHL